MPHVPYRPRPVPSGTSIESSLAPLSVQGARPDLPSMAEDAPDAVLDDFPIDSGPKRSRSEEPPQIERGKPRRRELGSRPGLSRVSMSGFNPNPGAIQQLLGVTGR